MLKNILKLNGAQELSKKDQKSVVGSGGGRGICRSQGCCAERGLCLRQYLGSSGGGCVQCEQIGN